MNIIHTGIEGCYLIERMVHEDLRGEFVELWKKHPDLPSEWVQENVSRSKQNVLRGLHIQRRYPQGKLVTCLAGEIFDIVVDLRKGSPSYKQWRTLQLTSHNNRSVYVPPGCAHGFYTNTPATVHYKCTTEYDAASDGGIHFQAKEIGLVIPDREWIMSDRDKSLPSVSDWLKLR